MHTDKHNTKISTWIAFSFLPLSGFATDIYVPSMPSMATQLAVSELEVQSTLTWFLISYGLSQLFVGSLLDSFGRYRIGLMAMVIFGIASFLIALTTKIEVIQFMRIIQGITSATIIVAKRAYFVDVYSGEKLKRYLSLFTIIWSVGPICAPFIGGYFQDFFGWQSNFYLLGGLVLIFAILDLAFGSETLKIPVNLNVRNLLSIYGTMLKTHSFMRGIIILSFTYSIVMMYNLTGSFLIENSFKMNSIVSGYCSLTLGFAWMLGGLISKKTILTPFKRKLKVNVLIQLGVSIFMIIVSVLMPNMWTLIAFAFAIQINTGYTYNNIFVYCLSRFPAYAAMSGGLTGGVVYVFVSILTFVTINIFPAKHMFNLGLSNLILTIASLITISYLVQSQKRFSFNKT